jgi:hypothetical protein
MMNILAIGIRISSEPIRRKLAAGKSDNDQKAGHWKTQTLAAEEYDDWKMRAKKPKGN